MKPIRAFTGWYAVEDEFSWRVCSNDTGLVADLDVKVDWDKERAHLIAAAPELYDALRDAIDDLEQVFKMCHGYVDTNDLARYRNALAKAKLDTKKD